MVTGGTVRELVGELWTYHGRVPVGITTNGLITRAGLAVMGRGCAAEAARRWPALRRELGARLRHGGNHVYWFDGHGLFTFPVKHRWWEPAELEVIRRSARELMEMIESRGWRRVILPRPGCGNGRRTWAEVRPVLEPICDDRILVIAREGEGCRDDGADVGLAV
jgi:hypothetical protein